MEHLILSFCLPCYNVGEYVGECIASIVSQGLPDNSYEILCCDDCSSDDTLSAIKTAADACPSVSIKWFQNEKNRGVSHSRNRMLREARGKYIWWVDADDAIAHGAALRFTKFLTQTHCDVVLGNYLRCAELPGAPAPAEEAFQRADMRALPADQNGKRMCAVWGGVFRRAFLLENRILFNENMIAQEDTLYYYEVECCSPVVFKSSAPCYYYRQRSSSVMHTRSVDRAKRYYEAMLEMLRVYEAHRSSGKFLDAARLEDKIRHSEHNVVACLSAIPDTAYVKQELKRLRSEGRYPCRYYPPILKSSFARNLLPFLNPLPPFFWLNHLLYKAMYRIRSR